MKEVKKMNENALIIIGFVALLIDNLTLRIKVSSIKRKINFYTFLVLSFMSDEEENLKVENVKFERMDD